MKKIKILLVAITMIASYSISAQIAVTTDGSSADASAMLDVKSSNKGLLIPRMDASQRASITSPATGLLVYQTDAPDGFYYYSGSGWIQLSASLITQLADADNDTKIEVEKNTDEDHIRLTTAGTTRMVIDQLGEVGIGTTDPETNLTIFSDEDNKGLDLQTADNTFNQGIRFRNSGAHYTWRIYRKDAGNDHADLVFANGKGYLLTLTDMITFKAGGAVGIGTTSPDASALLDVASTTKGFLPPRMTAAERDAISNPIAGLIIYCIDCAEMNMYNGTGWTNMVGESAFTPFTCGDAFVDARDDKTYTTVQIGTQCWMAENLNIGTMLNSQYNQSDNGTIEKYCYSGNCNLYGGLYQWNEMMQYTTAESTQGICPTGWYLPSDAEWLTLEESLDMCSGTGSGCSGATNWRGTNEGSKMADNAGLWTNGNLENDPEFGISGLAILPGGCSLINGTIYKQGDKAYLWSSSENGVDAWLRSLDYDDNRVYRNGNDKTGGSSVRCLKN